MYQRRVSLTTGGYEPPETATGELDDELTGTDDGCRLPEDELEVVELDAAAALASAAEDDEAETPGMVSALTAPKMPTPATPANATPAVTEFSSDSALSRARILASAVPVVSMVVRMGPAAQSSL